MQLRGAGTVVPALALLLALALVVGLASACSTEAEMRSSAEQERAAARSQDAAESPAEGSPDSPGSSGPGDPAPTTAAARLGLTTGWGPSADELEQAAAWVHELRLPDLAGQVIVADWSGTRAPTALVDELHLGGVIWFSENIATTDQVRRVNAALQRRRDRPWPLLIGVDQEGGLVERVRGSATRFPAFMTAGAARTPALTRAAAAASGAELRGLGFTTVFAPVADVTLGAADPTIGSRAASSDPEAVAVQAAAAARGFADAGLVATLKHFPGHGSVRADSHLTLPVQRRTRRQLDRVDLLPFAEAVRGDASAVMVGHLDVRALDPGVPSSLSRPVVDGVLREELGFDGLVVSDSLAMAAITQRVDAAGAAVRTLRAGVDVVLMPADPRAARRGIVAAVRSGRLTRRRLEQAAGRQVALLLHHAEAQGARPGSGRRASYEWSRAAVTSVTGPCRGRLVPRTVQPVGDRVAVAYFRKAAAEAGLRVGARGARVALLAPDTRRVPARVAVAVDAPWVLGWVRAPVELATYGSTPGAMRALVDVLLGRQRAPGRLPAPVAGARRRGC